MINKAARSRVTEPSDRWRLPRYSSANQLFHWVSAVAMVAIIILGWLMAAGGPVARMLPLWEWHKSLGLLVLFVTLARMVWRTLDPPPPPSSNMAAWDHYAARATYILFFATMLLMPVSGYLWSTAAGHPPILFDLVKTPAIFAANQDVASIAKSIHLTTQWLIYALILLHLAGVVFHVAVVKDHVLDRMLPEPAESFGLEPSRTPKVALENQL